MSPSVFNIDGDEGRVDIDGEEKILFIYDNLEILNLFLEKNKNSEKKNNITLSPMKYNLKRRIDKTYLKYNSPQKTKNNEKILIITPKNNIFQLSDNSKKIKKEIYELKKQIDYKEPIIANLTNINKPNEFY